MEIIGRSAWGARQPTRLVTTTWERRKLFIVHYSGASSTQTVRAIQDYCMDTKGFSDIDYNALVDTSGRIYEGRTGIWLTVGSHTLNNNTAGIGVCYIGDNSTPLTEPAKAAIRWLYDEANRRKSAAGFPAPLITGPHSTYVETSCPGDSLRAWLAAGLPAAVGDDMEQTDKLIRPTDNPGRVIGDTVADLQNKRNWEIGVAPSPVFGDAAGEYPRKGSPDWILAHLPELLEQHTAAKVDVAVLAEALKPHLAAIVREEIVAVLDSRQEEK